MNQKIYLPSNFSLSSKALMTSFRLVLIFTFSLITLNSLIQTFNIALSISILITCVSIIRAQQIANKRRIKLEGIWPELIDILISGIESGLTLSESLSSLSTRGPDISRKIFSEISDSLKKNKSLDTVLTEIKGTFLNPICDQVCEVIHFSQKTGSRDTSLILRTLGTFISEELLLREEINAKHSWIKNSALLASISPWILLVLLTTQADSRSAYSSTSGFIILFLALFMTASAYIWMERISRIPDASRGFPL